MKSFLIPILCLSCGFLLGKLSNDDTYVTVTATPKPSFNYIDNQHSSKSVSQHAVEHASEQGKHSLSNSSRSIPPVLSNLIAFIPDESIASVISLFLDDADINELDNVSQFATRYLEEISLTNSEIDPESFTSLSIASDKENTLSGALLTLGNAAPAYAHFDVSGGLGSGSSKILSRWVNLDTNSVLFFDTNHIKKNSDKNWVSFIPDGGWKSGNYEVTFYKFGSQLNKLASQNFYVEIEKQTDFIK